MNIHVDLRTGRIYRGAFHPPGTFEVKGVDLQPWMHHLDLKAISYLRSELQDRGQGAFEKSFINIVKKPFGFIRTDAPSVFIIGRMLLGQDNNRLILSTHDDPGTDAVDWFSLNPIRLNLVPAYLAFTLTSRQSGWEATSQGRTIHAYSIVDVVAKLFGGEVETTEITPAKPYEKVWHQHSASTKEVLFIDDVMNKAPHHEYQGKNRYEKRPETLNLHVPKGKFTILSADEIRRPLVVLTRRDGATSYTGSSPAGLEDAADIYQVVEVTDAPKARSPRFVPEDFRMTQLLGAHGLASGVHPAFTTPVRPAFSTPDPFIPQVVWTQEETATARDRKERLLAAIRDTMAEKPADLRAFHKGVEARLREIRMDITGWSSFQGDLVFRSLMNKEGYRVSLHISLHNGPQDQREAKVLDILQGLCR